jgi:parallel beta-helix repeat protein
MVLLFCPPLLAGAQLVERPGDQILHVDGAHPRASDQNPGSRDLPFKTISRAAAAAVAANARSIGSQILIGAGTYREGVELPANGRETDAPMIFAAVGEVIVSGSDVWTGWRRAAGINVFSHPWPYAWGLAPVPAGWESAGALQDIVRRSEMVFVNGAPLDQVLSRSELQANRFYVDEKARTIAIQLPEGLDADQATVEVAVRPRIFWASGKTHIVLRGIIFQHASTALDEPAVRFYDASHIWVEGCQFRWNNWGGLGFGRSRNVTARKNVSNHNGGAGIGTWKTNTLLFEETETSHNNWRGKKGSFTGWAVAGMKNLHTHGGIFRRHRSVGNQTHGIWFDTDCEHILVDEALFSSNLRLGIYLEANQGPLTIRNSRISRNSNDGILIGNSSGVTLEGNIIYGNAGSQIMVSGLYDSARPETDWETGAKLALLAQQAVWKNNAVVGTDKRQLLVSTTLSPALWALFVNTLFSDGNLWFHERNPKGFQFAGGYRADFKAWQSATGQDANSVFADPAFSDPEADDFRLLPGSPFLRPREDRNRSSR